MTLHSSMIDYITKHGINLNDAHISKFHRYADLGYFNFDNVHDSMPQKPSMHNHAKVPLRDKKWLLDHIRHEMGAKEGGILYPKTGSMLKALRSLPADIAPTIHEVYGVGKLGFVPDSWLVNIDALECPNICIFEVVNSHDMKPSVLAAFAELQWALECDYGSSYLFRICAKTGHVSLEQSMSVAKDFDHHPTSSSTTSGSGT